MRSLIAFLALALPLAAQNMVTNGDFEAPTIAPWVLMAPSGAPGHVSLEWQRVNGSVESRAASMAPDNFAYSLEQEIALPSAGFFELRVDLAAIPHSVTLGKARISVVIEQNGLPLVQTKIAESWVGRVDKFQSIALFKPTAELVTVRILFDSEGVFPGRGHVLAVDNLLIRRARSNMIMTWEGTVGGGGRRYLGEPAEIHVSVNNDDCDEFVLPWMWLFVSFAPASGRIPVPGIGEDVGIDPASIRLFAAAQLDRYGQGSILATVPEEPALLGLPLWWQGVGYCEALSMGTGVFDFNLTWETMQSFEMR